MERRDFTQKKKDKIKIKRTNWALLVDKMKGWKQRCLKGILVSSI